MSAPSINLTTGETKLFLAVMQEMKSMPDVDFDAVANKVGIKHAKNAKQSFRKVWDKLKACADGTANGNGAGAEEGDGDEDGESPKKTAAKKTAAAKKAPLAKKGVAKATAPKKAAAEVLPKAAGSTRPTRKTKKQKDEEAAAAAAAETKIEAAEPENNEDEDMDADNEDGKFLNIPNALSLASEPVKEPVASNGISVPEGTKTIAPDTSEVASALKDVTLRVMEVAARVKAAALPDSPTVEDAPSADEVPDWKTPSTWPMNDEYEAYIREMPLEAWLKWKAESGYTFDLISI